MARKNTLTYKLLNNQSLSADFISPVTVITNTDNLSYQINCTTTDSIGTFSIEVSNDYSVNPLTGIVENTGTWNPLILGGGTPNVNATDAVIDISINQIPFNAIRLSYTSSNAGTGTCSAYLMTRQLGG